MRKSFRVTVIWSFVAQVENRVKLFHELGLFLPDAADGLLLPGGRHIPFPLKPMKSCFSG